MKKRFSFTIIAVLAIVLFPKIARAETIDSILTDGKLVIPSVPFDNSVIAMDTIYSHFYDTLKVDGYGVSNCNSDYTHCTLTYKEDSKEVDIVWKYDPSVKKIVDEVVKQYPKNVTKYIVEDVEVLNMYINGGNIVSNSLEFKKNIQYKNFFIDQRGGGGSELLDSAIGMLKFRVDGILYWKGERDPEFISRDLVYVKEDATDVAAALQERIEKLFPEHTFVVEKTDDPIQRILDEYIAEATEMYNNDTAYFISEGYATLDDYLASKHDYDFLDGAEEYLYDIAVDDAFGFQVAVKKDSTKAVEKVEVVTNDVLTNVTIKVLGDVMLPLDTKIQAEKLTEGEEYEKILSTLKVSDENSDTYDLALYSKSLDKYYREIENGKFEVSIPIPEKLEGKTLQVYFVGSDDKVETFEVKAENGYATFITSHFSTYTLVGTEEETANPKTADSALLYISLFGLSTAGLITLSIYTKKRRYN